MRVKFRPGPSKVHQEVVHVNSCVFGSLADFADPADDIPVAEEATVEEYAPLDFR